MVLGHGVGKLDDDDDQMDYVDTWLLLSHMAFKFKNGVSMFIFA